MADGNSLINLGGLSKPVNTLIEKIAAAIGIVYEPTRIIRKAKADAKTEEILELNKLNIDDLKKRAVNRLMNEEAIKQDNIERIIEKTIPQIKDDAKAENIDNDWIAHFFEKSRVVSNNEMQILWGKILAGEANQPGSFSRLTLNIIYELEKKDADMFTSIASCTFNIGEPVIIIFFEENTFDVYEKHNINFLNLNHLETLGLIKLDSLVGFQKRRVPQNFIISYFGFPLMLEIQNGANHLSLGNVLLTQAGQQLISICGAMPNGSLKNVAEEKWKKEGVIIRYA